MLVQTIDDLSALPDGAIIGWDTGIGFGTKTGRGWVLVAPNSGFVTPAPLEDVTLPASLLYSPYGHYMSPETLTRVTASMEALSAVLALFVEHAREMVLEFGMGAPSYVEGNEVLETVTATLAKYGLVIGDLKNLE